MPQLSAGARVEGPRGGGAEVVQEQPSVAPGTRSPGPGSLEIPSRPAGSSTLPAPGGPRAVAARAPGGDAVWGAESPPEPRHNFDTLVVGSFNRFAHAAATTVVSNPGAMYNPLLVHGAPCAGKTHLLHAVGRGIQEASQGAGVFFTSGPRLGRAVRLALSEGRGPELAERIQAARCLVIDDLHLLQAGEDGAPVLAAIVDHFLSSNKHVAVSSCAPPRTLAGVDAALKLRLDSGGAVELKVPSEEVRKSATAAAMTGLGLKAGAADVDAFLERLGDGSQDSARWLRRLGALSRLRDRLGSSAPARELLPLLFLPEGSPPGAPSAGEIRPLISAPSAPSEPARTLAVLFPRGFEDHARFMLGEFHGAVAKNGLPWALAAAEPQEYDPEAIPGAWFSIAESASLAGAGAALVLGPAPGTAMAGREPEMVHSLEKLLPAHGADCALVPMARLREPGPYFRAVLDLYQALQ